jgi:hypothetical protein
MPWIIVALGGVGTLIPLFSPTVRAGTDRPSAHALSGCPLEGDFGLPAYFAYEPEGRTRSAEAAIVLPAGFKEVRRLLDDVRGYPDWVLLGPEGSPLLSDMSFDPQTGKGAITIGEAGEMRLEGVLTRTGGPTSLDLRLEMLGGEHVQEAVIEFSVSPYERCEDASLVEMRATWKVGLLTHVFASEAMLSTPASFLIAIRDDLAARLMESHAGLRQALLDAALQYRPEAPARSSDDSSDSPGVSLVHFEPAVVQVDAESALDLGKIVESEARGKRVKAAPAVRAFVKAMSGTTRIVGYHARFSVEGIEQPMRDYLLRKPGNVGYEFRVAEDGFTLSYGVF